MSLIGNVLKPLAKSVLIPLGLTAAASATDAAIHKKMIGSWKVLVKQLKIKKKNKIGFLGILLGTLATSLLGNI